MSSLAQRIGGKIARTPLAVGSEGLCQCGGNASRILSDVMTEQSA